jgi:hypothetical protein
VRKEILFAVIAGVVFGVIVAFGVWRANSALKSTPTTTSAPASGPTTAPVSATGELELTLAKPEENDVIVESPVILSGVTRAGSWITISGQEEDHILKADASGAFSQEVNLVGGVNTIAVSSFDDKGKSIQKYLTVVFSSEFAKDAGLESATGSTNP